MSKIDPFHWHSQTAPAHSRCRQRRTLTLPHSLAVLRVWHEGRGRSSSGRLLTRWLSRPPIRTIACSFDPLFRRAADATVALASRVCLPRGPKRPRGRTVDGADSSQIGISTSRRLPHDVEPRLHRSWCGSGPLALSCLKTLRTKTLWSGRWFIGLFCICPSDDG